MTLVRLFVRNAEIKLKRKFIKYYIKMLHIDIQSYRRFTS